MINWIRAEGLLLPLGGDYGRMVRSFDEEVTTAHPRNSLSFCAFARMGQGTTFALDLAENPSGNLRFSL